ncbi:MAG: hypothetical protein IK024_01430 [Treponema sp.]|nr:hypothetical protein [Treponema sp.]
MKKNKIKLFEFIILIVLLTYFILSTFCCGLFFKNKYTNENFTFYYNEIEKYNLINSDKNNLENYFEELSRKLKLNPFYKNEKKIKLLICDNYALYTFLSNINYKSIGITKTFGNYGFIVFNKTDFNTKEVISQNKKNNVRSFESVVLHESTHVFITKIHSLFNRFYLPSWKEEGICESIASESSYDIEKGLKNFLSDKSEKSPSYKYFLYRLSVLYMKNQEKLSYEKIINDKRNQNEILSTIKIIPYEEIEAWFY